LKELNSPELVVKQLQNLSMELYKEAQTKGGKIIQDGQIIAFKINSCLYGKYPL
jgi:hypothetical protein